MFRSEVVATYNTTLAAEYALNKLHGLEYPLGEFISVESKVVNKLVAMSLDYMRFVGITVLYGKLWRVPT